MTIPLAIVAAIAENGVIGRDNRLPWHLGTDLKRFRALTMGKPLILGRKNFESLPQPRAGGPPLPGRELVVLTRDRGFAQAGIHVAHDRAEALAIAQRLAAGSEADAVMIAGGAEIYAQFLPMAERLHLTHVHARPHGDVHFPPLDLSAYREVFREEHRAGPADEYAFTFADYERQAKIDA